MQLRLRAALLLSRRLRCGWKQLEAAFSLRDVYVHGWAGLATPDEVRAALLILEEAKWLRKNARSPDANGERPTEEWSINPRMYARGDAGTDGVQ